MSLGAARTAKLAVVLVAGVSVAACVSPNYPTHARNGALGAPPAGQGEYKVGKPYQVAGVWYVPQEQPNYDMTGTASWYGDAFHMKATANGETFDMNGVSAAHTTLPLPSMVEVTNLDNGRKLVVRVNDRGPFVDNRIIDLSREAARQLGYDRAGLAKVRVRYVGPAPLLGPDGGMRYAQAQPLSTRMPRELAVNSAPRPAPYAARAAASGIDPVMELASGAPRSAMAAAPIVETMARAPVAAAVTSQALPPITGAAISSTPIPPAPSATTVTTFASPTPMASAPVTPAVVTSALSVQAGAFTSQANARLAVSQLSRAGAASIVPLQREDGLTLYRVVLPAPTDEAAAYALRDRVAEIGFVDARVVRTF